MKIAIVNWTDRKVGGAETYLSDLLPRLQSGGDLLAFWCQRTAPPERESVVPEGIPVWSVDQMGLKGAVGALRAWKPDVLYINGLTTSEVEESLGGIAPVVFYAHGYYGTCITGGKTLHHPEIVPCSRTFGPACLGHFYLDRCGGSNPLTMISDYRLQKSRLERLRKYSAVLCASTHMRDEYVRNGVPPARVRLLPYPVEEPLAGSGDTPHPVAEGRPWRIVCAGRLEPQKGGRLLLEALPAIARELDHTIELTFAGDGREAGKLEAQAQEVMLQDPRIVVRFTGWISSEDLMETIRRSDLLAVPSVWPEPFGLIGVEAGHLGVPAAAFAVGGIPDWLEDGTNGMLAPASPPTADGIAAAIIRCLDPATYPGLSQAARTLAARFSAEAHVGRLREVLAEAHLAEPGDSLLPANV